METAWEHEVTVREETASDVAAVRSLLLETFPTCVEADLVDALRAAGRLWKALVAVQSHHVIGVVGFSPVTVEGVSGGLGLAPLAVQASARRRGVAARLVVAGLEHCRGAGVPLVVVLGDPGYYRRWGFEAARHWGLVDEYGGKDAFQVLALIPGSLPAAGGVVRYCAEFASFRG